MSAAAETKIINDLAKKFWQAYGPPPMCTISAYDKHGQVVTVSVKEVTTSPGALRCVGSSDVGSVDAVIPSTRAMWLTIREAGDATPGAVEIRSPGVTLIMSRAFWSRFRAAGNAAYDRAPEAPTPTPEPTRAASAVPEWPTREAEFLRNADGLLLKAILRTVKEEGKP